MWFGNRAFAAVIAVGALLAPQVLAQTNGILREVYSNIGGNAVANLTSAPNFPNSPSEEGRCSFRPRPAVTYSGLPATTTPPST